MAHRVAALVACFAMGAAHASTIDEPQPSNNFDYTRTTTYTYDGNNALLTKTTEPNRSVSCSVTTFGYSPQGNVTSRQLSNCQGASGRASITPRATSSDFSAQAARTIVVDPDSGATASVSFVPGVFALTTHDQDPTHPNETIDTDPRFGAVTRHVDMNGMVTSRQLDAFGRVVLETYPDGTSKATFYCATALFPGYGDRTSFSPKCPTPSYSEYSGYVPSAVTFVHTEPRDVNGAKMGPFVRAYQDALGRTIRTVTESYDGPTQAASVAGSLIYQDTVYDKYGSKVEETKPFFAATASSTTTGSHDYGATLTTFDAKGRPTEVDTIDPNASASQSKYFPDLTIIAPLVYAKTTISYQGMLTTTTNDAGQARLEERDGVGNVVRVTDAQGAQLALLYDAFGNVVQTVDALGNTTRSQYDYLGNRVYEQDPDKGTTQHCYDVIGQVKAAQTAQMRGSQSVSTCPNIADAGVTATAQSGWATFAYDLLGHLTARVEPDMSTTWYFDKYASGGRCGAGRQCESVTNAAGQGTDRRIAYDGAGRVTQTRLDEGTGNPSFGWGWAFSPVTGRMASMTYPTGLQVSYDYSTNGFMKSLTLLSSATIQPLPNAQGAVAAPATWSAPKVLWQPQAVGAQGQVEKELYGNNVTEVTTLQGGPGHIIGRTASSSLGTLTSQTYSWDSVGNVRTRNDNVGDGTVVNGSFQAVTESFGYDGLNRLTGYSVSGAAISGMNRNVALQYNAVGELLSKSDGGFYTYPAQGAANPHALQTLYDNNGYTLSHYHLDLDGNVTSVDTGGKYRHLSYNSFDRVSSADNTGSTGTPTTYSWLYDERHARVRETRVAGGNTRTNWYINPDDEGGLAFETEFDSTMAGQSNRHYLTAQGSVVGVLVSTDALAPLGTGLSPAPANANLSKVEYWHVDHLGSLIATTDHTGAVTARYDYDPFGQRRYANGVYDAAGNLVVDWNRTLNAGTGRGFTRHEELDDIGLVNMNGRLFDAALGRFIQSDRHVPHELQLQSYDRYAYVMDNPLNATDPSGFTDLSNAGAGAAGGANTPPLQTPGASILNNSSAIKPGSEPKTAELSTLTDQQAAMVKKLRGDAALQLQMIRDRPWWVALIEDGTDPNIVKSRIYAAQVWQAEANLIESGHLSSDDWAHLVTAAGQTVGSALTAKMSAVPEKSPCCFVAGTPVLVEHGSLPIEKIEVGMLVQSRDEKTGVTALKPVTQLIRNDHRDIYALVLLDASGKASRIEASDNHPFWVIGKGWLQTVELKRGMHMLGFDSRPVTVINLQAEQRSVPTYNFTVADFHTFFAGETPVLVHNASGPCDLTSNAARRQVMNQQGVPTSQQPISQSRNDSGREYTYEVPAAGGGTKLVSVQQQTMDRSHADQPHWEAGTVKTDPVTGAVRMNNYDRPAIQNSKSKADYKP